LLCTVNNPPNLPIIINMSSHVSVKARLEGEVHRFAVNTDTVTFAEFQRAVYALFEGDADERRHVIKYTDDDGDAVTIGADPDLREALLQVTGRADLRERILRVEVVPADRTRFYPTAPPPALARSAVREQPTAYTAPPAAAAAAPSAPPAEEPKAAAEEDERFAGFYRMIDYMLSNSQSLDMLNMPFISGAIDTLLPSLLASRLQSSPYVAQFLNQPRFLEQYLPKILDTLIARVPRLAAALARDDVDALLTADAPQAAGIVRAWLAAHRGMSDPIRASHLDSDRVCLADLWAAYASRGPAAAAAPASGVEQLLPLLEGLFRPQGPAAVGPTPFGFGGPGFGGFHGPRPHHRPPHGFAGPFGGFGGRCGGGMGGMGPLAALFGAMGGGGCPAMGGCGPQQQQQRDDEASSASENDSGSDGEISDGAAAEAAARPSVHEGVQCDVCQAVPITGTRWKCSVCDNFDLCDPCQATGRHPASHPLLMLREPLRRPKRHMHPHGRRTHAHTHAPSPVPAAAVPASAPDADEMERKMQLLSEMGFADRAACVRALGVAQGNVERAVALLIGA
jgi:hypothetical protein